MAFRVSVVGSLVGMIALFGSGVAFAEEYATPARPSTAVFAEAPIARPSEWTMTTAGALMVANGTGNAGLQVGVATPLSVVREVNLFVGGNAGLFFLTGPFNVLFAPLPEAYLSFDATPKVHPRAGVEAGLAFSTSGVSTVRFAMFFKPGIDVWLNNTVSLNFEPKLGILGTAFAFVPQLGVTIGI